VNKALARYRYPVILLKQLVKTDFKLRYQGSLLGYIWSLLRPLLLFVTLYFVFHFLGAGKGIEHFPQYLLLGVLLWTFFSEVTSGSVGSIVGKGDLLRKINFPKYVIILANAISAFINLLLNFVVLAIFMIAGHVHLTWHALLIIPLIMELFLLSISLAFFLSALFVRFRDITYIWEVIMQAAFYATPILYKLSIIPHNIAKFMILNPMAQIIQDARYALISPNAQTDTIYTTYGGDRWVWAIPIGITLALMIFGVGYFRSRAKYFAEKV
jgi:ABC-2 type transport system permease protein